MINRVSTSQNYSALLANLQSAQSRSTEAQAQLSSGKVGTDLKSYAGKAETLTASRAVAARTAAYLDAGQGVADQLSAQDLALGQVSDAADAARQAVTSALANGDATGLMSALQSAMTQATGALNTQYQGRQLFGGGNDQTAPVQAQTLADLTAAPVATLFKNDQRAQVSRVDDQTTVKTGVLASDVGQPLMQALADIQTFAQGAGAPLSGKLTSAQTTFLQSAVQSFIGAHGTAIDAVAANGQVQSQVESSLTHLKARDTQLKSVVGDLTDVDMAEVATRLQLSQVAVQASAQVFQTLQASSLLNVLSSS